MIKMRAPQASGPTGGKGDGLYFPVNQLAPAGTGQVFGGASQPLLAGAYDVGGSLVCRK